MIRATWEGTAVSDNDRLAHSKNGRMFASREYKNFKADLAQSVWTGYIPNSTLTGRVRVMLTVDLPPRMDTSAIIKAACDAVQLSGAIKNDNQIDRLIVERVGRSPRGQSRIDFQIEEVE